jgi:hypothetical protein
MTGNFDLLMENMAKREGSVRAVVVLGLILCLTFFLAVGAYAYFSEEEATSGRIPDAVAVLRDFVSENESVAVFLGFSSFEEDSIATNGEQDAAYEARVREKAAAYIAEKEGGRA